MPIIIPPDLPTRWMLESEGIFVIDTPEALRQDIRPLRIALLDLSGDDGQQAELALAALLGRSPLQIEVTVLATTDSGKARSGLAHVLPLAGVSQHAFDGLLVSHDPADWSDWSDAPYWDELRDFLDWATERVLAHLYIGSSAQAALHHFYGVPRHAAVDSGRYRLSHRPVRPGSFLLRGFDETFDVSIDRRFVVDREALLDVHGLESLAESLTGEPYLIRSYDRRKVFALHRPDTESHPPLADGGQPPHGVRSHGALMIANWVNYYVYQPVSRFLRENDGRPAS